MWQDRCVVRSFQAGGREGGPGVCGAHAPPNPPPLAHSSMYTLHSSPWQSSGAVGERAMQVCSQPGARVSAAVRL